MKELPQCSDLLVRFYPASTAWCFLRELPIAGYSRKASDDLFHINFALFLWQKDPSIVLPMGMPSLASTYDSYGIEMLWSLGYMFQDKYNANPRSIMSLQQKHFYDLCCSIWRNLKQDHCYQIHDVLNGQTSETSHGSSELKEVAFAILTPDRIEYQPLQGTLPHRGFAIYPAENWLLVHIRDRNGIDNIHHLDLQTKVRFRNFMLGGIPRGNRRFQYFGSSNSQVNIQAGWFLSLPQGITMDSARQQIGDLSNIHNVSTYIARVGLYLTTTKATMVMPLF